MPKISVCIPTHEMLGREFFLRRSLDVLWEQSFQDFEVVVTDNSEDEVIENICNFYGGIKYFRNPRKGMAQNTNEAILRSEGELIKVLYLDDYLAHEDALDVIWKNFKGQWLVTGCEHDNGIYRDHEHLAQWSLDIKKGVNTIGSPSVMTIRNRHPLLFDERMTWVLDCDYYQRMYHAFGPPTIIDDINVVIGLGKHQTTHILTDDKKRSEQEYLITKK